MKRLATWLVGTVGVVVWIFAFGFILFAVNVMRAPQRTAEQADGIIVEMKKGPGILGKYHPRVRFQTREGKTIEFSPGNGSNPPMYEVNDHVPVVYNSDYPNYAAINSFIEIWLGPVIYAGLGLLLILYSGFQWVKSTSQSA